MSLRVATGCAALVVVTCVGIAVAAETVQLRVGCVRASNKQPEADAKPTDLGPRIAGLLPYRSYYLVKEKREKVTLGDRMIFEVPGGRHLVLLPKVQNRDGSVLMRVVLVEGKRAIINTSVSLKKHGIFLVGGPQNNDGALILAIDADEIGGK